jgi:hypothetical protein
MENKMKIASRYKTMKVMMIFAVITLLFSYSENAGATDHSNVISGSDTSFVIIKKNYDQLSVEMKFQNLPISVVPDTTHDIIIIFRGMNWININSGELSNISPTKFEDIELKASTVCNISEEV